MCVDAAAMPLRTDMLMQCDKDHCCLVVTTGGTGPAVRDVTPDATEAVRILVSQLAQRCTQAT